MKTHRVTAVFLGVLALTVGGVAHEAVAAGYTPPEFSGVVGEAVNGWGTLFEPKCSGYRNFVIHWGDGATTPPRAISPATPGVTISGSHIYLGPPVTTAVRLTLTPRAPTTSG